MCWELIGIHVDSGEIVASVRTKGGVIYAPIDRLKSLKFKFNEEGRRLIANNSRLESDKDSGMQ